MHPVNKNETMLGIASLPKTEDGFIDKRNVYNLCGKYNISLESLQTIYPHEFVYLVEGKIEAEREYFEAMTIAIYSGTGQILSKKPFKNPFEKKHQKPVAEKVVGSKEGQKKTFEELQELFGISVPNTDTDDTEDEE